MLGTNEPDRNGFYSLSLYAGRGLGRGCILKPKIGDLDFRTLSPALSLSTGRGSRWPIGFSASFLRNNLNPINARRLSFGCKCDFQFAVGHFYVVECLRDRLTRAAGFFEDVEILELLVADLYVEYAVALGGDSFEGFAEQ